MSGAAKVTDDKPLNPWVPMSDPLDVAVLGKLMEEASELVSAAARCLIQGVGEIEPITGKPNREWLADEIADVIANLKKAAAHFGLSETDIFARALMKEGRLDRWHAMIETASQNKGADHDV